MSKTNDYEVLKKNRPDLSDSSVKVYVSNLRRIRKMTGLELDDPKDVCTKTDEILEALKDVAPSSRKTILSSLIVFCDEHKSNENMKKLRDRMIGDVKAVENEYDKQEVNEKSSGATWEQVLELKSKLEEQVKPMLGKKNFTKKMLQELQKYLVVCLYTDISPRRLLDYTEFRIRNVDKTKDNYMSVVKKKNVFVFNKFKIAKKAGQQMVEITPQLKRLVNVFVRHRDNDWLLNNINGDKMNQNGLKNYLQGIFKSLGKISVNELRHLYVTHKYKDVDIQKIKEVSKEMGQDGSLMTLLRYVKK